jgi:hypothetical protein
MALLPRLTMLRFVIAVLLSFPVAGLFTWATSLPYVVSYIFAFLILVNAATDP